MKVVYHPAVQKDVSAILRHYESISSSLADEFWGELQARIEAAARNPEHFHFGAAGRRRVNLRKFPYHFLFRVFADGIRITVVRHHNRAPRLGLSRK